MTPELYSAFEKAKKHTNECQDTFEDCKKCKKCSLSINLFKIKDDLKNLYKQRERIEENIYTNEQKLEDLADQINKDL